MARCVSVLIGAMLGVWLLMDAHSMMRPLAAAPGDYYFYCEFPGYRGRIFFSQVFAGNIFRAATYRRDFADFIDDKYHEHPKIDEIICWHEDDQNAGDAAFKKSHEDARRAKYKIVDTDWHSE